MLYNFSKHDKLVTLDLVQKSIVKWSVEGDENTRFFVHGMLKNKMR